MRLISPGLLICLAVFTSIWVPSEGTAGRNQQATAALSWDDAMQISDLPSLTTTPHGLYVLIHDATDLQALAFTLRWTPNSIFGPCYYILPDSSSIQCGSTRIGNAVADSMYTLHIEFPEGVPPSCIAYAFGGDNCGALPASICLGEVVATDGNGEHDTLQVTAVATVAGGVPDACPPLIYSVTPSIVLPGATTTLTIHGSNLDSLSTVAIQWNTALIEADSTIFVSDSELRASLTLPSQSAPSAVARVADAFASLDIVVTSPSGEASVLRGALNIAEAQTAAILNLQLVTNGDWPVSPTCTVGDWVWVPSEAYMSAVATAPGVYSLQLGSISGAPAAGNCTGQACPYHNISNAACVLTIALGTTGDLLFTSQEQYTGWYSDIAVGPTIEYFDGHLDFFAEYHKPCSGLYVSRKSDVVVPLQYYRDRGLGIVTLALGTYQYPERYYPTEWDVTNLRIGIGCPIAGLAPLSGSDLSLENGTVNTSDLSQGTQTALGCLQAAVASSGGTVVITSGYRSPTYQEHLREVWTKWRALRNNTSAACAELRAAVREEYNRHGLDASTIAPASGFGEHRGRHVSGTAFDATFTGVNNRDELMTGCGLWRPYPTTDPVHVQLR